MANLNKVILIGRCTRDAASKTMGNGGVMTNIGLAVSGRKKTANGWEDDPTFLDIDVFDRGEWPLASTAAERCKKGAQIYVEGKLKLDQWTDKATGEKRSKLKVIAESIQYLDAREQSQPKQDNGWGNQRKPATVPSASGEDADIPF